MIKTDQSIKGLKKLMKDDREEAYRVDGQGGSVSMMPFEEIVQLNYIPSYNFMK